MLRYPQDEGVAEVVVAGAGIAIKIKDCGRV
jgi:hypothetical protein